jgi:hypothetical protein
MKNGLSQPWFEKFYAYHWGSFHDGGESVNNFPAYINGILKQFRATYRPGELTFETDSDAALFLLKWS